MTKEETGFEVISGKQIIQLRPGQSREDVEIEPYVIKDNGKIYYICPMVRGGKSTEEAVKTISEKSKEFDKLHEREYSPNKDYISRGIIYHLKTIHNLTYEEIGNIFGVSGQAVQYKYDSERDVLDLFLSRYLEFRERVEWLQNNPYQKPSLNKITSKPCTRCEKEKDLNRFYPSSSDWEFSPTTLGRGSRCKDCNREVTREWYYENWDRAKEWRENNQDKIYEYSQKYYARKNDLPFDWGKEDQCKALEHFNHCCVYCGGELNDGPHWEHFIPISSDNCPGTTRDNMLPSCQHCNSSKSNSDPHKWISRKFPQNSEEIISRIEDYFDTVT